MRQFYLIGGGPCSGKTSTAMHLADKHGLQVLRGDDLAGVHQREAAKEKYPISNYLESLSPKEQELELVKLTSRQELARQEELFFMLLKELRAVPYDRVIIEGNFLLPKLVKTRFEWPYKSIWLLPTHRFQQQQYPERPWMKKLITRSDQPGLTLVNLVQRDFEFNKEVRKQARRHRLPYMMVSGKRPIHDTFEWAEQKLGLADVGPGAQAILAR